LERQLLEMRQDDVRVGGEDEAGEVEAAQICGTRRCQRRSLGTYAGKADEDALVKFSSKSKAGAERWR
jgi:hypothetical protein